MKNSRIQWQSQHCGQAKVWLSIWFFLSLFASVCIFIDSQVLTLFMQGIPLNQQLVLSQLLNNECAPRCRACMSSTVCFGGGRCSADSASCMQYKRVEGDGCEAWKGTATRTAPGREGCLQHTFWCPANRADAQAEVRASNQQAFDTVDSFWRLNWAIRNASEPSKKTTPASQNGGS